MQGEIHPLELCLYEPLPSKIIYSSLFLCGERQLPKWLLPLSPVVEQEGGKNRGGDGLSWVEGKM